ncbi:MAG: HNH endonuclease [Armatimonas sp.]
MNRNRHPRLGDAPHKPILLLAILDGIEGGSIRDNKVALTPELVATFRRYWKLLVPENTWQERIIYPFRYLASEGFWELTRSGAAIAESDLGHPTSIGRLTSLVDFGRFVPGLWTLLSNTTTRAIFRNALLTTYFPGHTDLANQPGITPAELLRLEAERLITEASRSSFRPMPIPRSEQESDVAYLRHYLFPRVVTALYENTCSICRLQVWGEEDGTIVDAAHVMPFARFHNDDPRNGIALCKNHHWGFDRGWFTITEEYRVRRSGRIKGGYDLYLTNGAPLLLPTDTQYAPASEALFWHSKNVFLG